MCYLHNFSCSHRTPAELRNTATLRLATNLCILHLQMLLATMLQHFKLCWLPTNKFTVLCLLLLLWFLLLSIVVVVVWCVVFVRFVAAAVLHPRIVTMKNGCDSGGDAAAAFASASASATAANDFHCNVQLAAFDCNYFCCNACCFVCK